MDIYNRIRRNLDIVRTFERLRAFQFEITFNLTKEYDEKHNTHTGENLEYLKYEVRRATIYTHLSLYLIYYVCIIPFILMEILHMGILSLLIDFSVLIPVYVISMRYVKKWLKDYHEKASHLELLCEKIYHLIDLIT